MLAIVVGYIAFIIFVRREGARYFQIETEIELAREIHRSLVPTFERKLAEYEIFGVSIPSGDVGGDLVDIAESSNGWIVYSADISARRRWTGPDECSSMPQYCTSSFEERMPTDGHELLRV